MDSRKKVSDALEATTLTTARRLHSLYNVGLGGGGAAAGQRPRKTGLGGATVEVVGRLALGVRPRLEAHALGPVEPVHDRRGALELIVFTILAPTVQPVARELHIDRGAGESVVVMAVIGSLVQILLPAHQTVSIERYHQTGGGRRHRRRARKVHLLRCTKVGLFAQNDRLPIARNICAANKCG